MPVMKVTKKMLERELASIDWDRIDAMTDADIEQQIRENPDAAPLPSAKVREVAAPLDQIQGPPFAPRAEDDPCRVCNRFRNPGAHFAALGAGNPRS